MSRRATSANTASSIQPLRQAISSGAAIFRPCRVSSVYTNCAASRSESKVPVSSQAKTRRLATERAAEWDTSGLTPTGPATATPRVAPTSDRHGDGGTEPARMKIATYNVNNINKRLDVLAGSPPPVSLAEAREQATDNKRPVRAGGDPLAEKRKAREVLTFSDAVERYLAGKLHEFRNEKHRKHWRATLDTYAAPVPGHEAGGRNRVACSWPDRRGRWAGQGQWVARSTCPRCGGPDRPDARFFVPGRSRGRRTR